jgi:hypothetical protein
VRAVGVELGRDGVELAAVLGDRPERHQPDVGRVVENSASYQTLMAPILPVLRHREDHVSGVWTRRGRARVEGTRRLERRRGTLVCGFSGEVRRDGRPADVGRSPG